MGLYLRLMNADPVGTRIPVHQFQALVALWAKGKITAQQAQAGMTIISGEPLTPAEVTEVQALVATVPTGATTANQAARALRLIEIDQILLAVSHDPKIPPLDTEAGVKAALGV